MAFDILIRGGTVVDGSGGPGYKADIGVSGNRIEAIGPLAEAESARVIDASGKVVTPGFIDMHTHSDVSLVDDPGAESMAYQGVTTQVTGNCSFSPFPTGEGGPEELRRHLGGLLISNAGWTWDTLDDWANDLESNGVSLNVAPQVGQGSLRVAAGATEDRPANPDEMREMQRLACEAFEQGAFALSTGLSFAPSAYASTDELVELSSVIPRYEGAFFATHARTGAGKHISMIEEAVETGLRAEVPVQFSHISITDGRFYGEGPKMLALLNQARADGLDITYDIYPYTAAGSNLDETIPMWAQKGTHEEYMDRMRDPETRERLRDELTRAAGGLRPLWDTWQIANVGSDRNKNIIGMTIEELRPASRRRAGGGRAPAQRRGGARRLRSRPQQARERRALLHVPAHRHVRLRRQVRLARRPLLHRQASPPLLRHVPAHPGTLRARRRSHDTRDRRPQDDRLPGPAPGPRRQGPARGGQGRRRGRVRP